MKPKTLALSTTIFISLFLNFVSLSHAATSTQSAVATNSATTSLVKEQVEKALKKAIDPEVKGLAEAAKLEKFGLVGTLEKIVGSSMQVRSVKGVLRLIELDHGAVILKDQKQITKDDLELNVPIIVMGYRQDDDTLLARRVIISEESILGKKRLNVFGKTTEITTKLLTLKIFKENNTSNLPLKITTKTTYWNGIGDAIKRTEIKAGDPVIAILSDADTDLASGSALKVYSLSPKAIPSPTILPISN